MAFNEDDYPMVYKEYEKRVIGLFLEDYSDDILDELIKRVEDELSNEPNFIQTLYGQSCFIYESPIFMVKLVKKHLKITF